MACTATFTGRDLPCYENLGGVKYIAIESLEDVGTVTVTAGEATAVSGTATWKQYEMKQNSGSLVTTINGSAENGTTFFTSVVSATFHVPAAADINDLSELKKGRLSILVRDMNGNDIIVGHGEGAYLTGGSITTGATLGDASTLTVEFTAIETTPPPFVASSLAITLS